MKKIIVLFAAVAFTLTSCIAKRNVSINFEKQTDVSLQKILDSSNVVYSKGDIATLKNIMTFANYSDQGKLTIPEAYFFNRDGYRVRDNFKGTRCGQVITNIHKVNDAPVEHKEHIDDWLANFEFMDDPGIESRQYDAYVILTWAHFIDKDLHEANVNAYKWYKSLKENKDVKIKAILLNLDVQEKWVITDEQKESLGM